MFEQNPGREFCEVAHAYKAGVLARVHDNSSILKDVVKLDTTIAQNDHRKFRGHFPDDESARKLVYLAIRNHESNWKRPMAGWYECLAAFHAHFQDRLTRQS